MPLLVNSVPNLVQGVSQQPDSLRLPGQCEEQVNAWATVVEGLVKRPNTNFVSKVSTDDGAGLFTHFVKRDEDNKYCVTVSLGGVGVIDLEDGTHISVATTSIAQSYLSGITNPLADLRALTVADYTFLVNKKKTVAKDTTELSVIPDDEALVFVKLGDYRKSYSIYIDDSLVPPGGVANDHIYTHLNSGTSPSNWQPATYISGDSNVPKHADTAFIAKDLKLCLDAELGSSATTTLKGIDAITVTNGGSNYPYDPRELYIKVEVEVTQPSFGDGTATALGVANVDQDPQSSTYKQILSVDMIRKGTGFSTDQATYPLVFTVKQYKWIGLSPNWMPIYRGSGATFSVDTSDVVSRANLEITRKGSVIRLKSNDGPFKIRVEDGLSNEGLGLAYQEVASITDLPKQCFNNFSIKVKGDADIDQDDYFVRFSTKDKSEFGEGTWVECVGWTRDESESGVLTAIETTLDATTMPITLVPVFTGDDITSFKLQTPEEDLNPTPPESSRWRTRAAGNDETNPFPSFVGKTINDVFFFKNRLGFLTDSNVIFSEADEYFNFFRTTTQQLLDSAPIDVGISHTKVAVLQYAKAFQEKLMLFSDSSQFVLRGADVLSPKTVAISPVSEYDTTDNVEPLVLGNYIYFPFNRDKYVGMYEYYVDNNTEVFEAQEITEHVTKYIPSTIRMMAGSTTQNTVLVQSLAEQGSLFVYKYFWSGKEKIQSAWQKFTFNGGVIRGFDFVDSTLYLLVSRGGSLYLEKLFLEEGYVDRREVFGEYFFWDPAYPILLDCSTSSFEGVTHAYDAVNDVTTLSNIPINISADDVDSGVLQIWSKYGRKYDFTRVDDTTITINGRLYDYVTYNGVIYKCLGSHDSGFRDKPFPFQGNPNFRPGGSQAVNWTTLTGDEATIVTSAPDWEENVWYEGVENFVIGYSYNMLYKFSEQTLKQPTERGGRSASNYTYQTLRTGSLNYADTGHFTILVTPKHRDTYYYPFNSNLLGEGALVNKFTPQDGHFQFPIQAQPDQVDIEIRNDSALPVKLLGAEFESMIIPRTRRYGA